MFLFPQTMQDFLGKWKTYAAEMVAEKQVRDQAAASKLAKKAQKERAELRAQAALAKKPKTNTVKRKPLLNVNILTEIKKPWVNKRLVKRVSKLMQLLRNFSKFVNFRCRIISKARFPR